MKIDFDKLSKAEQRVLIAKDLIARLKARRIVALQGTYVRALIGYGLIPKGANDETDLREVLAKKKCRACEIGGLFLCALDRHDKLTVGDSYNLNGDHLGDGNFEREYLRQWFSKTTLTNVEAAFEGWEAYIGYNKSDFSKTMPKAKPAQRMREICENIIRNNGTFKVSEFLKLK